MDLPNPYFDESVYMSLSRQSKYVTLCLKWQSSANLDKSVSGSSSSAVEGRRGRFTWTEMGGPEFNFFGLRFPFALSIEVVNPFRPTTSLLNLGNFVEFDTGTQV